MKTRVIIGESYQRAFEESGGDAWKFFNLTAYLPREEIARIIEESGFLKAVAEPFRQQMLAALAFNEQADWLPRDADLAWIEKNIVLPFEELLRETLSYRIGAATALALGEAFTILNGAAFTEKELLGNERRIGKIGRAPAVPIVGDQKNQPAASWDEIVSAIKSCKWKPTVSLIMRKTKASRDTIERRYKVAGFTNWQEVVDRLWDAAKK